MDSLMIGRVVKYGNSNDILEYLILDKILESNGSSTSITLYFAIDKTGKVKRMRPEWIEHINIHQELEELREKKSYTELIREFCGIDTITKTD